MELNIKSGDVLQLIGLQSFIQNQKSFSKYFDEWLHEKTILLMAQPQLGKKSQQLPDISTIQK